MPRVLIGPSTELIIVFFIWLDELCRVVQSTGYHSFLSSALYPERRECELGPRRVVSARHRAPWTTWLRRVPFWFAYFVLSFGFNFHFFNNFQECILSTQREFNYNLDSEMVSLREWSLFWFFELCRERRGFDLNFACIHFSLQDTGLLSGWIIGNFEGRNLNLLHNYVFWILSAKG